MAEIKIISLECPVKKKDGKLALIIPLEHGGIDFQDAAKGISKIVGTDLIITIQEWLAQELLIQGGSLVSINNSGGKFNINPVKS